MQINTLLGDVLFTSDQVGNYSDWQEQQLRWRDDNKSKMVSEVRCKEVDEYELVLADGNRTLIVL